MPIHSRAQGMSRNSPSPQHLPFHGPPAPWTIYKALRPLPPKDRYVFQKNNLKSDLASFEECSDPRRPMQPHRTASCLTSHTCSLALEQTLRVGIHRYIDRTRVFQRSPPKKISRPLWSRNLLRFSDDERSLFLSITHPLSCHYIYIHTTRMNLMMVLLIELWRRALR